MGQVREAGVLGSNILDTNKTAANVLSTAKRTVTKAGDGGQTNNSLSKAYINAGSNQGITIDKNYGKNNEDNVADTGGTGVGTTTDYYTQLMNAFMQQNEAARQAALDAIMQNLNATKKSYNSQLQSVKDEYESLIDQNEVKKERQKSIARENQANLFGNNVSGIGRQELLDLESSYDNQSISLQKAQQQAINDIYALIMQAEADANTNKANVNNTYNNALLEYQLANA